MRRIPTCRAFPSDIAPLLCPALRPPPRRPLIKRCGPRDTSPLTTTTAAVENHVNSFEVTLLKRTTTSKCLVVDV